MSQPLVSLAFRQNLPTMRLPILTLTALLAMATACGTPDATAPEATAPATTERYAALNPADHLPAPIAAVYRAHAARVPAGRDLSYDLALTFGGRERFRGEVRHDAATSRIAMTRAGDGASLRYDGTRVAVLPDTAAWPRARFAVFTWPYFGAAGFKLADPGTQWAPMQTYGWADGQTQPGAKLTFASGTGDAPDDYYVAFADAAGRLDGLAYVVTFGKDAAAAAAAEPHAIRYSDYREVGGVPVAHRWDFYMWDPETGLGRALGFADLSDVAWVGREASAYATAGGAEVPAP